MGFVLFAYEFEVLSMCKTADDNLQHKDTQCQWAFRHPPCIKHKNKRPPHYREMVQDAARNLCLSKQETALLAYYGDCKDGFRPSKQYIESKTGIPKNSIQNTRKGLIRRNIIAYNSQHGIITVLWPRIEAFAMLTEPLKKGEALKGKYSQPEQAEKNDTTSTLKALSERYWDDDSINWSSNSCFYKQATRPLTETEARAYRFFSSLTESEYQSLLTLFQFFTP